METDSINRFHEQNKEKENFTIFPSFSHFYPVKPSGISKFQPTGGAFITMPVSPQLMHPNLPNEVFVQEKSVIQLDVSNENNNAAKILDSTSLIDKESNRAGGQPLDSKEHSKYYDIYVLE